jgi:transposase InsO family protein
VLRPPDGTGQFTSWMMFTERAKASGLTPSMGSIGDCYDNAVIESFWGRVQTELLKSNGGRREPTWQAARPVVKRAKWLNATELAQLI